MHNAEGAYPIELLLVLDDPAEVHYTRETLDLFKVTNRLHVVCDTREAVDFLCRRPPHQDAARPEVVLLDLNLPGHDGRHLLRTIRAMPDFAGLPVLLLVDSAEAERILRTEALPVQGYVVRPVDFTSLTTIVRAVEPLAMAVMRRR